MKWMEGRSSSCLQLWHFFCWMIFPFLRVKSHS